jgi:hypothetical protein
MGITTTQNFTLISKLLRKCEKSANKKVKAKTSVKNLSFSSSILAKVFGKELFIGGLFSNYFHRFEISIKFCEFWAHLPKKNKKKLVIEYIYEYLLELIERKFARNGLTN